MFAITLVKSVDDKVQFSRAALTQYAFEDIPHTEKTGKELILLNVKVFADMDTQRWLLFKDLI